MVKVKNITKNFGNKKAVENLSFELKSKEIVGLLGLNGSGKTTTIRILTCFLIPSEGEVEIDSLNIFDSPLEVKKKIGYLPETPPLYEDFSIQEYLEFVSQIKGISTENIPSEIERVSKKTDIFPQLNKIIGHLSLGYRKRVGIAQALLGSPSLIIMDEPISGLDPKQIIEMRSLIKNLKEDHTVLISSHILSEIYKTCDRFLFLHEGRLKGEFTFSELEKEIEKEPNNFFNLEEFFLSKL
ncbi:MAG: ABC transporter ATP-binding protein [Leptospiraceae bacterium]|nr:ABC transporter ATP-binding protein [Leptospiraceae bacterium]NUM41263.1 ABC transporter ATP-binding protein [Leptospiraceae bacterium]